jgi:hypothetical protein
MPQLELAIRGRGRRLAGALLIPREGALTLTKRNWTLQRVGAQYGVSEQLCRRRINETGVAIQARRWMAGWYSSQSVLDWPAFFYRL